MNSNPNKDRYSLIKYIMSKWIKELREKYETGMSNLFLITGNIGDYPIPGKTFKNYMFGCLFDMGFKEIVTFDYSSITKYTKDENKKTANKEEFAFDSSSWGTMMKKIGGENSSMTAYILEYPEYMLPGQHTHIDNDAKKRIIELHKVLSSQEFIFSDNVFVFLTESRMDINPIFTGSNSRLFPITVEYPDEQKRVEFIGYLKESSGKGIKYEVDNQRFAKLTAGLSLVHIEDIFLLAESTGSLNKDMIMDRKKEIINKEFGDIIEIYDTEGYSLEKFAGQEHIKAYHRESVINPILSGDLSAVPKGILYMGPPGTGKTYFSKCFAGEANINFVEFKMSKILDKYVGESERNLERAFTCFKSLAPVGVFIDEIDQALGRGKEDSHSVNKNIFGMFLSILSEPSHRGRIIWIGATNYPNQLDEALKRAGRFDKKIPFLPPTEDERSQVFKIHIDKTGYPNTVNDFKKLSELTDGYTQAEIENVVMKALEVSKRERVSMSDEVIHYAIKCIKFMKNDKIKEMTDIAMNECNDLEFTPGFDRNIKF